MLYWLMLFLAIITEVIGTSTMSFVSKKYPLEGHVILFLAIGLSYYFLSKALARIPMGITFAVWEGLGIASISFIGYFFFGEKLTVFKILGIGAIIVGIYLLQKDSQERRRNRMGKGQVRGPEK
jgi:Membrane transporters of cations and cationic drugs